MNRLISQLSSKILSSPAFMHRYETLEFSAAQRRVQQTSIEVPENDIKQLLLQSSVLALSGTERHKRVSQKINALLFEMFGEIDLVNYAIQLLSARLGNYPVIAQGESIFRGKSILNQIRDGHQNEATRRLWFDSEIVSNLEAEEASSEFLISDNKFYFNSYQKKILEALFSKSLVSFSAPTSFGKSFIVRHYIAKLFSENLIQRCLILVPTKALIDDFFSDLIDLKNRLGLAFSIFTNTRALEGLEGPSIFVLTQERLSFLIHKQPELINSFDLVYVDEAHYISRGYRGFVLKNVLQKIIFVAGISGIGEGTVKYVFTSPIIKNPEYYKAKFFPTLPSENSFHEEVTFSPVEKNIYIVNKKDFGFELYLLKDSYANPSFRERLRLINSREALYQNLNVEESENKILKNLLIVKDMVPQGGTILYTTSPIKAHEYAFYLASLLPDKEIAAVDDIADLEVYIKDHFDETFNLIGLIRKGIGVHYGPMPIGLRRAMVGLFEKGVLDYLICTSTLLEGVNLPAKNLFIFSDKQWGNHPHTPLSFWNLVGRAGRLTYGLSGNIFCIGNKLDTYKSLITNETENITGPEKESTNTPTRKKHLVRTFLEQGNYNYVKSFIRDDIEYLISELFLSAHPENLLSSIGLEGEELISVANAIAEIKSSFRLSEAVMSQNLGIDPRFQNALYVYFESLSESDLLSFFDNILNIYNLNASQIDEILKLTQTHFLWPLYTEATSRRIVQWLQEKQVNVFIQERLRYLSQGDDAKSIIERMKTAIDVIDTLNNDISFLTPKYLKCFFDLALNALSQRGEIRENYLERIDVFLFAIETGLSSSLGRSLYERGVSRSIAIKVSQLLRGMNPEAEDFWNNAAVKEILISGLSKLAYAELKNYITS